MKKNRSEPIMLTLQIIETAYRATLEEQDDPVVWITHAMRGAGAELAVLLSGNAVNYAVSSQDCSGLQVGEWKQTHAPRLAADLAGLADKGIEVLAVEDDLVERGIDIDSLLPGIALVPRARLAELLERFPRVWCW
jgi:intracellular sulfur oxidation DsrE/DsrF family protein